MPNTSGVFNRFTDLDQIPIDDILRWLNPTPPVIYLQNYIANKILYPEAVPISQEDLKIDLAIMREALKQKNYLNKSTKKIYIPEEFLERFPNISELVWVFIDTYLRPEKVDGVFKIISKAQNEQVLGSVVIPKLIDKSAKIEVGLDDKIYQLKLGSLAVLPCPKIRCNLVYRIQNGTIMDKDVGKVEVYGGILGLIVDGRFS